MLLCVIHFTAANAREKKKQHNKPKQKKPKHNTSIENNSLLLGLCTHISFVWLFFCLSHYPGGTIRSLQGRNLSTMALCIMVSKHPSHMSVYGVRAWFISFQVSKAAPISEAGSQGQPWRGQRGGAGGSGWETERGPFSSPSLGDQAGADTISVHVRTGITVKKQRWNGGSTCIRHKTLIDSVGARILFPIWIFSVRQFKDAFYEERNLAI